MKLKQILPLLLLIIPMISCAQMPDPASPEDYEACVAAGNPITKSYPPQCITKDGLILVKPMPKVAVPVADEGAKTANCKDLCGDGACQEIVCMAIGCPCAETHESCPQDCP